MREDYVIESAQNMVSVKELRQIGRYTRQEFLPEELYVSSVMPCGNEIGRDFRRSTIPALHRLGELFLGETGLFDHSMKNGDQATWIFSTHVETDLQKKTQADEPYTRLVARAYLPETERNADLILEFKSGVKKEVSMDCAVGKSTCSVCGADRVKQPCGHVKGRSYGGEGREQICHTVLDEPTDAYEWSFVTVPAQRAAGAIKVFRPREKRTDLMEGIRKPLRVGEQITLTATQTGELKEHLEQPEALAESGRQYRGSASKNMVRLCALSKTGIPAEVMDRATQSMSLRDPFSLEKALKQQVESILPLCPQLTLKRLEAVDNGNNMSRIQYRSGRKGYENSIWWVWRGVRYL